MRRDLATPSARAPPRFDAHDCPHPMREADASQDFEFAALESARHYRAALAAAFAPFCRGDVLEAGAGVGQITALLHTLPEVRLWAALEPEARFCARLRAAFPGLRVIQGTIDALRAEPAWDTIVSTNVLEHIQDDARELACYRDRLRSGSGTLCLFVPARPEVYAPIDRDFGHYRRYRHPRLAALLESSGFRVQRLHYYNLAGYLAWWFSFCLLRQRRFRPGAVRWFDRLVFPPTHWLETHVCRPPLGQSLLAIAQKV